MAFDYLNEAFKRLEILDEEMFDTSVEGINNLTKFMDNDFNSEVIRVIDPETTSEEELQNSYVGKVIINCNVCHSHIFENKENIVIDEEGNVNVEETCPYCGEQEGFMIVGEIRPYSVEESEPEDPVDDLETQDTPVEEDSLEEALGVGAGLALGGAAIGAGMVGSKLLDSVDEDKNENEHTGQSRATLRAKEQPETLEEDFKEVSITTEDQHLEMTSDKNGKVTVTTEPVANDSAQEEVISPISDETTDEIIANSEIANDDAPLFDDEEYSDFDFDEIDEEGLDELGESYFRNVYENVSSFKTTDAFANESQLIIEGVINFNSGVSKKTGFIFEAKDANTCGQVRFTGSNKQLTESTNAFSLIGRVDNKKLCVESLKYNYAVNNTPVRGVVRRK